MKIKFKHRADNYFWVTALFIFIVGTLYYLISDNTKLDINIHDTYFVIDYFDFTVSIALLYFLLGLVYWLLYTLRLTISPTLTKVHTKATTGIVILYLIAAPILNSTDTANPFRSSYTTMLLMLLLAVFILVQPLLLANIIVGLVRGRNSQS